MLTRHGLGLLDLNKDQQKDCLLQVPAMSERRNSAVIWSIPALNFTDWETEAQGGKESIQGHAQDEWQEDPDFLGPRTTE